MKLTNLLLSLPVAYATMGCRGDSGSAVDWFVVLKHNSAFDGSYLDSDDISFSLSNSLDSDTKGPLASTLKPVYAAALRTNTSNVDTAYAFWNDEKPSGTTSTTHAHSKGVVAWDGTQGFYLVHSVPKWPPAIDSGYSGLFDDKYGQSFLCVTLTKDNFNDIGKAMVIDWPYTYDSYLPDSMTSAFPDVDSWFNGDHNRDPTSTSFSLKTVGGQAFTLFAKNSQSATELYADVVAPALKTDLVAETWQNGGNDCGPYCKPDYTYNVEDVHDIAVNGAEWRINQDHSKWAIATSSGNMVCIGDINRQTTQLKRGGGTLCTSISALHGVFKSIITNTTSC